jgi:hypothetical protein
VRTWVVGFALSILALSPPSRASDVSDTTAVERTRLRGEFGAPDPRASSTLGERKYALTPDGVRRALRSDDQTAQVSALVLVSLRRWHKLLPDGEALLAAPPPVAVEAAATFVELGNPGARRQGRAVLQRIAANTSWPETQLIAAAYLARDGDSSGVAALRSGLASSLEGIRLQAVQQLLAFAPFTGRVIDGVSFVPLESLSALLARPEPSPLVRRAAAMQLVRFPPSPQRDALLVRLTKDPDATVRGAVQATPP